MSGRSSVFRFKQFNVDQHGCTMKINTDGVLLGALAQTQNQANVLDIGTGTGVIALMLAQRYPHAVIDAVEIDEQAAEAAGANFSASAFSGRLQVYHNSFAGFFKAHTSKLYNLIVSNPPFYLDALTSPLQNVNQAKHADRDFFTALLQQVAVRLTPAGQCWLILPVNTAAYVKEQLPVNGLYVHKTINVQSFTHTDAHRQIIVFGPQAVQQPQQEQFVIYADVNIYTQQYTQALKDFFIIF